MIETGDINGIQIGFKRFVILKTAHALGGIETEIVKNLDVEIIDLVKKDREVFVKPFCQKDSSVQQNFSLLRLVEIGKGVKRHPAGKIESAREVSNKRRQKNSPKLW